MQNISLLTLTLVATAALTAERFVSPTGGVAAAAGNTWGVAKSDGAIGEHVPVEALGTAVVTAGGAIAAGALVEVGAAGKAVTRTAGIAVGRAAPGATAAADGDRIEIFLIPN